jgi:maleylacetoacetate isomerase
MNIVLYGYWRSSSSHRVRLALAWKKVPHKAIAVNLLKGEQRSPEHLAKNPMGFVPCLVVDGKPFTESVAIIELLEDLFPEPPLYPRDPYARARVRALVELVNSGIQPLQNLMVLDRVSKDSATRKEWLRFFIGRGLTAYEALMAAHETKEGANALGPFSYGPAITAADVYLLPQVFAARRFGVDLSDCPRIVRAETALLATEAARAAAPENQPDAVKDPP